LILEVLTQRILGLVEEKKGEFDFKYFELSILRKKNQNSISPSLDNSNPENELWDLIKKENERSITVLNLINGYSAEVLNIERNEIRNFGKHFHSTLASYLSFFDKLLLLKDLILGSFPNVERRTTVEQLKEQERKKIYSVQDLSRKF
jgi:hypothetical protein